LYLPHCDKPEIQPLIAEVALVQSRATCNRVATPHVNWRNGSGNGNLTSTFGLFPFSVDFSLGWRHELYPSAFSLGYM